RLFRHGTEMPRPPPVKTRCYRNRFYYTPSTCRETALPENGPGRSGSNRVVSDNPFNAVQDCPGDFGVQFHRGRLASDSRPFPVERRRNLLGSRRAVLRPRTLEVGFATQLPPCG